MDHSKIIIIRPLIVEINFETTPVWLLAFVPTEIEAFCLPQCNSFSDLQQRLVQMSAISKFYDALVTKLGRKCFHFGIQPRMKDLLLFLGSIKF